MRRVAITLMVIIQALAVISAPDQIVIAFTTRLDAKPIVVISAVVPDPAGHQEAILADHGDIESKPPIAQPWYRHRVVHAVNLVELGISLMALLQSLLVSFTSFRSGISPPMMGVLSSSSTLAHAGTCLALGSRLAQYDLGPVLLYGSALVIGAHTAFGLLSLVSGAAPFFILATALFIASGVVQGAVDSAVTLFRQAHFPNFSTLAALSGALQTSVGVAVPPLYACLARGPLHVVGTFAVFGAVSALLWLSGAVLVPPRLVVPSPGSGAAVRRVPILMGASLVLTTSCSLLSVTSTMLPFLFAQIGASEFDTSLMMAASSGTFMFGSLLGGYLVDTAGLDPVRLMQAQAVVGAVAFALVPFLMTTPAFVGLALCVQVKAAACARLCADHLLYRHLVGYGGSAAAVVLPSVVSANRMLGSLLGNVGGGLLYEYTSTGVTTATFATLSLLSVIGYEACDVWQTRAAPQSDQDVPFLRRRAEALP